VRMTSFQRPVGDKRQVRVDKRRPIGRIVGRRPSITASTLNFRRVVAPHPRRLPLLRPRQRQSFTCHETLFAVTHHSTSSQRKWRYGTPTKQQQQRWNSWWQRCQHSVCRGQERICHTRRERRCSFHISVGDSVRAPDEGGACCAHRLPGRLDVHSEPRSVGKPRDRCPGI
jgi:hypothetical protein